MFSYKTMIMLKDNNDMAIKLSLIIQYNTPNFPNIQCLEIQTSKSFFHDEFQEK